MAISILNRATKQAIAAEPFPHIVIEEALPPDYYAALARHYPSFEAVAGAGPYKNNTLYQKSAPQIAAMTEAGPLWQDFVSYHVSAAFFREIVALFGDTIRAAYPALEDVLGRRLEDFTVGVRQVKQELDDEALAHDVKLDTQFGCNSPVSERSSVRTAHVDRPYKLISSLLYFRDPRDDAGGGDLELYRFDRENARFRGPQLAAGEYEVARTVPYRPNILVMWVNMPATLHGVSPREVTDMPRRYVNFICETFKVPNGLFSLPQIPKPASNRPAPAKAPA